MKPHVLLLLALAGPAGAAEPRDPSHLRDELRAMEALLDTTVEQVSRPNPGFFLAGAPSCRGYLLEGYGFVFVLPARWLPLRPVVVRKRRLPPPGPAASVTGTVAVTGNRGEPGLRELEVQVQAFQIEAEQQRAEAERAFEEMTRELRARLAEAEAASASASGGPRRPRPAAPPITPPAAPAPSPEPPELVKVPGLPAPPEPPAAPLPPPVGPVSPGAPWVFWQEMEPDQQEVKTPERLVADVRDAVVLALEAYGPGLTSLRADETISVVVDFVAGAPFLDDDEARPSRSLTLRVRKRDLDDRRAGRLGPEELRRKVEAAEY